jgi:hypothetical protein
MKHLLTDPSFPDVVGEWAEREARERRSGCANDNDGEGDELSDPFFWLAARAEIDATRIW